MKTYNTNLSLTQGYVQHRIKVKDSSQTIVSNEETFPRINTWYDVTWTEIESCYVSYLYIKLIISVTALQLMEIY